ncbi:lytic transglycosylase domain-containing protein [Lelliottia sp. V89_10]|uniref:lytic transglycosylase domain-containing protein n=1 Tax=Lelliottia wanjuensis TaxID=3050585 RepID=UPI00249DEC8E|nr:MULTISPECIES: lytic transglycosylase domain-containing protein [unclassified Lelliottia]MDI3360314.1 lytic transglycosylase domain-containing protein [Lelliottia sp. V89_13]MDK9549460.1 lytic transglycosylase domain-containing protein [Lelliottia sp. V89_5]MDK9596125.1 lytic transglycosylase domain-containing protein [Lelliottia sp. V89_10]
MLDAAAILALALQCAPSVHPDTTHDIAKTESGFIPLAIGVVGGRSIYPKSLNDALKHVSDLNKQGKNYSVGLMQINQANFGVYNKTAEELFNPCTNIQVYEKIITDCFIRGGTLIRALSCYYTGNFESGQKPESTFSNTSYTQRIGYVVPSTKVDKGKSVAAELPRPPRNIYPSDMVRGTLPEPSTHEITTLYPNNVIRGTLTE